MEKQNLPLHKHKVPMKLEKLEDGRVKIYFEDMTSHVADHVIWATGRKPNVQDLNLEAAGVTLNEKGFIAVDEYQNTVIPGIYALGDVTGEKELTPVAIKAGRTLSERLFNGKVNAKMDYTNIPTVVFSSPRYRNRWPNGGRSPANLWKREYQSLYFSICFHVHCCNPTPPASKIQTHHCWSRGKGRWPSWSWLRSR